MNFLSRFVLFTFIYISFAAFAQTESLSSREPDHFIPESVYDSSGLDKLSTSEKKHLINWIEQQSCSKLAAIQSSDSKLNNVPIKDPLLAKSSKEAAEHDMQNFGIPAPAHDQTKILHASVQEPFRGWTGKTIFYLNNGQIWKQRVSGRYTYSGNDNHVEISQNSWGFFEMRLVESNRTVGVTRIK